MRSRFLAATFVAVLVGCGGEGATTEPSPPPPPPPPPPVVTSIEVSPKDTLVEGKTFQSVVTASYDRGPAKTVTVAAGWSSSDLSVATVSAAGLVSAVAAGTADITAAYGGLTTSFHLVVRPDGLFWEELPPISLEARATLERHVFNEGRVVKWTDRVLKVWAQPGLEMEEILEGFSVWSGVLGAEAVADSASASVVFVWIPSLPISEPWAGAASLLISERRIFRAEIFIQSTYGVPFMGRSERVKTYAHEWGHTLGLLEGNQGHVEGCDVMSKTCSTPGPAPSTAEAMAWLYSDAVKPGMRVF